MFKPLSLWTVRPLTGGLIIATALIAGCADDGDASAPKPLRLVRIHTASLQSPAEWREFPGQVEAAQTADLAFRVPGKVTAINVREGSDVVEGQVLATLDDTDYRIQLRSREAEYDKAKADFERGEKLLEQHLIARADFEKLRAQEASALAALTTAQQNVSYTKLVAPFAGVIATRYVENYEDVTTQRPILTLQDISTLHVKVDLPESLVIRVARHSAANVFAILPGYPDRQIPLEKIAVSTEADPSTHTFSVTFNMPTIEGLTVLPGMSVAVRGRPPEADSTPVVMVPTQSVVETNEGRFAYVVNTQDGVTGVIEQRQITTGEVSAEGIVIVSGIEPGDRVVSAGMSKMSEGLNVRLSPEWAQ